MAVGTIRNVMINGVTYSAAADIDISHILSEYENARIPTSGKSIRQMTKRVPAAESVVLITSAAEAEQLRFNAESTDDLQLSFTLVDGSTYMALGSIELENRETATGRTTLQLQPDSPWVLFSV
jgi:hypothetical protein